VAPYGGGELAGEAGQGPVAQARGVDLADELAGEVGLERFLQEPGRVCLDKPADTAELSAALAAQRG